MIVTTNSQQPSAEIQPKKLNHITTEIIPNAEPRPAPVGDGFKKMITTNAEPLPKGTEALCCEIEDKPYAEAFAKKIDADFKRDATEPKKAGRPRKAE